MTAATSQEIAEANRRRYEELRAAGQGATLKALPDPTARDGAPIAPDAVISREASSGRLVRDHPTAARRNAADHR